MGGTGGTSARNPLPPSKILEVVKDSGSGSWYGVFHDLFMFCLVFIRKTTLFRTNSGYIDSISGIFYHISYYILIHA
jgi:hypothetical protein